MDLRERIARLMSQVRPELAALVAMLATLRDAHGNTTVRGLDNTQVWAKSLGRGSALRSRPVHEFAMND
jgi:hypothetical protein